MSERPYHGATSCSGTFKEQSYPCVMQCNSHLNKQ